MRGTAGFSIQLPCIDKKRHTRYNKPTETATGPGDGFHYKARIFKAERMPAMPPESTPMMQQYLKIKKENPDAILFFRLGDFYEMFNEDAVLASQELDLTLTSRDRTKPEEERTPMCGVPYHSCDGYIARLIAKGYKVAICEQMEDPAAAKGIVKREIGRASCRERV